MSNIIGNVTATGGGVPMDTSRLATKDNLTAAGTKFESIFVGMMLKSMRGAKLADGLFESKALDQFRDMQDQQLAQNIAAHAPMGIGKAMTDFLAKSSQTTLAASPTEGSTP